MKKISYFIVLSIIFLICSIQIHCFLLYFNVNETNYQSSYAINDSITYLGLNCLQNCEENLQLLLSSSLINIQTYNTENSCSYYHQVEFLNKSVDIIYIDIFPVINRSRILIQCDASIIYNHVPIHFYVRVKYLDNIETMIDSWLDSYFPSDIST